MHLRRLLALAGLALSIGLGAANVAAQQPTPPAAPAATTAAKPSGPPAGFVAPAEPKLEESNAQRSKTQPGNNAPFWRDVRSSGNQPGFTTLPGLEQGVLIQQPADYLGFKSYTAGEAWRQIRNRLIIPYGGALLLIALLGCALLYFAKGPIGGHEAYTGRKIERFTPFERAAHWSNAIAFTLLAVSGLVMAFGKYVLLPVIGSTLFGYLTYLLKNVHNFAGPVFAVSLVVVFLTFVRDNFPRAGDLKWLFKFGGMLGGEHVPSHRFNAAEKVLFWAGVFALGATVVASGLVLDKLVPWVAATRGNMQIALIVHGVSTVLMMAMFAGHIYMGTVGTKDAFKAMRTGYVDEGWATEHHKLWADDVRAGRIAAQRSALPLGDGAMPSVLGASNVQPRAH
jgi:formate dehydrogenase subunit gamma